MKRFMRIILVSMVACMVAVSSAYAERGGHEGHGGHGEHFGGHRGGHAEVGVVVGPGLWWPGLWEPYPYYPYYSPPPVVIQQPQEIYVQPAPQADVTDYWYFCPEPQGYYPYVKACPKGWMRVVPSANPPK